jgi:hypothetical protein
MSVAGPVTLVGRKFLAPAPNRLWVADLTYVKTHAGWVYAAFILDVYSRMVVGWQLSNSLRSDLAIDALEMADWNRTRAGQVLDGLVHHSDRGVQYLSIHYSERLDENDIVASVGSRGDSYDNPMAESFNALYSASSSLRRAPGRVSTTSSSPRSVTSTGSITAGSTARSPRTTPTSPNRVRSHLLPSNRTRPRGGYPTTRVVMDPRRVIVAGFGNWTIQQKRLGQKPEGFEFRYEVFGPSMIRPRGQFGVLKEHGKRTRIDRYDRVSLYLRGVEIYLACCRMNRLSIGVSVSDWHIEQ